MTTGDDNRQTPNSQTPNALPGKFLLGLLAAYLLVVSLASCGRDDQNPRRG
ncbi:MAG TPA: hypothetical protein VE890_09910 [Thermoguttaceae bacterium]|nr:hypothetical protein [Thermoguttaceae bacterium]